ncbi:MAG: photosynthetic complex assembly protein PuhC [Gemmatimonadaceae bacterium]|uniref:photosynthetic complex assembly protein PuhC n=1 Tax=Gemmatimonas sp. TaxID=1962908 RepID=UPI001DEB580D|nr:photosynthetic complex assembly protein PuhC [Gemmatimonas sp.]NCW44900.1 photosynthetic complex assembly protein PuhC [Gemmatimonadaceae bacterium]
MGDIIFEPEPGARGNGDELRVPKPALYMAAAVAVFTVGLAVAASQFGVGADRERPSAVLVERSLHFRDAADHGITVIDASTNTVAAELPPNGNGFLRGALRALTRSRRAAGAGDAVPFRLVRYTDGRLVLLDPVTQQHVTITSFGPTQIESFDRLLQTPPTTDVGTRAR